MESELQSEPQREMAELKAQFELQKEHIATLQLAIDKLTTQVNAVSIRCPSDQCKCGERQDLDSVQDTLDTMKSDAEGFLVKLFAQYRSEVETIQIWVATELSNQLAEMRSQLMAETVKFGFEETLVQLQRGSKKSQARITELETRAQQELTKNATNFQKIWAMCGVTVSNPVPRLITQDDLELTTAKLITAHDELAESQDAIWDSLRILFTAQDRMKADALDAEADFQMRLKELRRSLIDELAPRVVIHDGMHHVVTPMPGSMGDSSPRISRVSSGFSENARLPHGEIEGMLRFPSDRVRGSNLLKPKHDSVQRKRVSPRKFTKNSKDVPTSSVVLSCSSASSSPNKVREKETLRQDSSNYQGSSPRADTQILIVQKSSPQKTHTQTAEFKNINVNTTDSSVTPRRLFMREEDIDKFSPLGTRDPSDTMNEFPPTIQEEQTTAEEHDEREARINQKRKAQVDPEGYNQLVTGSNHLKDLQSKTPSHQVERLASRLSQQESASSDSEPDRWEHEVVLSEQFADATEGSCTDESEVFAASSCSNEVPRRWPTLAASALPLSSRSNESSRLRCSLSGPQAIFLNDPSQSGLSRESPLAASNILSSSQSSHPSTLTRSAAPTHTPSLPQSSSESSLSAGPSNLVPASYPASPIISNTTITPAALITPLSSISRLPTSPANMSSHPSSAFASSFTSSTALMPTASPHSIFSASLRSISPQLHSIHPTRIIEAQKPRDISLKCTTFIKHAVGLGKPKSTLVSLVPTKGRLGTIQWEATQHTRRPFFRNKPDHLRELAVADITKILVGKLSETFQRGTSRHAIAENCFSLVSSHRTLDLEASTHEVAKLWVDTIARLCNQ